MYQRYKIPFKYDEHKDLTLSVEKEGEQFIYRRQCRDEEIEKILAMDKGELIVNPIEPLTKPKELTPYFLIMLDRSLMVEPRATKTIFLTFPIEVGVYIFSKEEFKSLDSFTFVKPKFTLYGDPRQGVICKYWRSDVSLSIPNTDPFKEGIMELKVTNNYTNWVEITQAVFNAYGMKIYYDDHKVSMKARMRIAGPSIAETEFIDSPIESGMKKSLEIYMVRKLSLATTTFQMELGI